MATRQYIGARYVPKFFDFGGSTEWREGVAYEALTIVTRNGNSFTSKIPVPSNIGAPESNPTYWAATGIYNEQVASLSQAVSGLNEAVEGVESDLNDFKEDGAIGTDNLADDCVTESKLSDVLKSKLKNCRVLCHRGYSGLSTWARDNSQMAYTSAFIAGFNGFECDLRKDANGTIVCLHDASVDSVSITTGLIANLAYTNVYYKSQLGWELGTKLCTLKDAIEIAKNYNGFILFDMGKGVVSITEVVAICEAANFYNYGFFGASDSELTSAPGYAIKVWNTDVFTHTEEELKHYLTLSAENNVVRIQATDNIDDQINLIKSLGFKIIANYDTALGEKIINNIDKIDFLLGDVIPFDVHLDKIRTGGVIGANTRLSDIIASLDTMSSICFQLQGTHPDGVSGTSLMVTLWKQGSNNYVEMIGVSLADDSKIYKRVVSGGVLHDWQPIESWINIPSDAWDNYNSFNDIIIALCQYNYSSIYTQIKDAKISSLFPNTVSGWNGAYVELHKYDVTANNCWFTLMSRSPSNIHTIHGRYNGTTVGLDTPMN